MTTKEATTRTSNGNGKTKTKTKTKAKAKAKDKGQKRIPFGRVDARPEPRAKYRDLSTAQRTMGLSAASVEMTCLRIADGF
jgi:hypothetical protein